MRSQSQEFRSDMSSSQGPRPTGENGPSGGDGMRGFSEQTTTTTTTYRGILDGLEAPESEFTSLNEVLQPQRRIERIETNSREWYFSPNCVGKPRPLVDGQPLEAIPEGSARGRTGVSFVDSPRQSIPAPVRRENTFQSTTTLVGSNGESFSEVVSDETTEVMGDDQDSDFYAMSPILGAKRLPSLYDSPPFGSLDLNRPRLSRRPFSWEQGAGTPPPASHRRHRSITAPNNATNTRAGPSTFERTQPVSEKQPAEQPARSSDNVAADTPAAAASPEGEEPRNGESLVESSVMLQVSIVNRSRVGLADDEDNGPHSTLECYVETASYRQYNFENLSEQDMRANGNPGFLRRSKTSLRRLLSARNKFIAARSRSFMRRLQREVDLEMQNPDAAWQPVEMEGASGPVEIDGVERLPGPFEVTSSPSDETWGTWGARPQLLREGTFTKSQTLSRMCCALFGRNMPRELHPMCKIYMEQLDARLTTSMKNFELQTPNVLNWPKPLQYLENCLKVVASRMDSAMSIEQFVKDNFGYLMLLMKQGPTAATASMEHPAAARPSSASEKDDHLCEQRYLSLAHEWMLFCLEAWTMLDMTAICNNRHDLRLSENFCQSPLNDTIESLLPRLYKRYNQSNRNMYFDEGKTNQLFSREMTAEMLLELGGVRFVWTDDITNHLKLDTKTKTVSMYSHVAFAYLHAEAGTESSLSKSGLLPYHHILTEITESYRLLFGSTDRSRKLFSTLDVQHRSAGYYDVFVSQRNHAATEPRWLYTIQDDFPVFGDRLVELRCLLKPKGLSGLWRDTRDSLQWYTFWAVVVIGGVSLLVGFIQTALGTVQAYASVVALKATG